MQSESGDELRRRDRCRLRGHQEAERDGPPGSRCHCRPNFRRHRRIAPVLPVLHVLLSPVLLCLRENLIEHNYLT